MPEQQQDTTYEAPVVAELAVDEGPASVQAGAKQQTPVA
jgi:hypothetical protein